MLAPLAVSVVLVLFGGLMSGLTLGLMSLDTVQLEILKRTGSPVEKERAARIMPVRRRGPVPYPHPNPRRNPSPSADSDPNSNPHTDPDPALPCHR